MVEAADGHVRSLGHRSGLDASTRILSAQLFPRYDPRVVDDTGAAPGAQRRRLPETQPRWLSDAEQEAWRAFLAFLTGLEDRLDRQLQRDAGMPHAYYQVLAMLSEAPGRTLRMSELAVATTSSPSRLSHAVARLEEKGWVRRDGTRPTAAGRSPS